MLILEGKSGLHVKLVHRKRKSFEILVYLQLHRDKRQGLFVGGWGQNKARTAEGRDRMFFSPGKDFS